MGKKISRASPARQWFYSSVYLRRRAADADAAVAENISRQPPRAVRQRARERATTNTTEYQWNTTIIITGIITNNYYYMLFYI